MAARLTKRQAETTRSAIKSTSIINRLQSHIDSPADDPLMSQSQVSAALGLLRKTIPDLKVRDAEIDDTGALQPLSWDK